MDDAQMQKIAFRVQKILVAVDFSPDSDAAFQQAIWLARNSGASIVLAHIRSDLRRALQGSSYEAWTDFLQGEGNLLQAELRRNSDTKLQHMIARAAATDLDIRYETLLGEPYLQLTHAVQSQGFDLVFAGTRGLSAWKQIFVGSTAKKLVRSCPADVWIVKAVQASGPKVVLAATDFSEASLKAIQHSVEMARFADAELHLLHVIDAGDFPQGEGSPLSPRSALEQKITAEASRRLDSALELISKGSLPIRTHLAWGTPWQQIVTTAKSLSADLVVLGTVGRTGLRGLLIGNTAEQVLDHSECSVLTVKPDDYLSPVDPNFWPQLSSPA